METARIIDLDTVRDRLSRLLEQGGEVLRSHYRSELSLQDFVDAARFREWRVGCLVFLKEAFGLSVDRCASATSLAASGRFSQGRNQAALKHKGERT